MTRIAVSMVLAAALAGCGPNYSPNTYSSNAVQQANKVDQGVIVGVRPVDVSASGATGAVTGAAAGGIAGSEVGSGVGKAFGVLGGTLVGGIAGTAAEHVVGDTQAFEYIVRKPNGDLVSVTQKDQTPLPVGQKVLVIAGNQARIVPDYTVAVDAAAKDRPPPVPDPAKDAVALAPPPPPVAATPLAPPPAPPQTATPSNGAIPLVPPNLGSPAPAPQVENGP